MKKSGILFLAILVAFTQFFYFPLHKTKAAESAAYALFDSVEVKNGDQHIIDGKTSPDNKLKLGETVQLEYAWSAKGDQSIHPKDAVELAVPKEFKIQKDTVGKLTIGETLAGQYYVTAKDNKVKLEFNEQVKNLEHPKGIIKVTAIFGADLNPDTKSVQVKFPLGGKTQSISIPVVTEVKETNPAAEGEKRDNRAKEDSPSSGSHQPKADEKKSESQSPKADGKKHDTRKPALAAEAGKQITQNILKKVTLTDKDGRPFDPENRPTTDSPANIEFDWALGDLSVKKGDYFKFDLPKQFAIYNTIKGNLISGDDGVIGTFEITTDGKVTMTFNETIESEYNVVGKLQINTKFDKAKIKGSTTQKIVFPINDPGASYTVEFKPDVKTAVDKSGLPDKPVNAKNIHWTVNVNTTKDKLIDAVVKDALPSGLKLNHNSIKIYVLDVDVEGNKTRGELVDLSKYKNKSTESTLEIDFPGEINQAYQIQFDSEIVDETIEHFKNTATLKSNNQPDKTASASVWVPHGKHLDKTSKYDPKTQTITWKILYNGDERVINQKDAVLHDLFDNTHQLIQDSIKVNKVTYDDSGKAVVGEEVHHYSVTNTKAEGKNGFDLQFNENIKNAYQITYQTKASDNVLQDGKVVNTVKSDGQSGTSREAYIYQQNIIKWHQNPTNYKDKTTNWKIVVNYNNYEMNNAVIIDKFANGGLHLDESTFNIYNETTNKNLVKDTDYTLNSTDSGFTVTLKGAYASKMKDTLVITYTTTFDYSKLTEGQIFKNTTDLIWKDGLGKEHTNTSSAEFDPDTYTKSNGFKNGSYNAQTKEITWAIGMNYNHVLIHDPIISDRLLDGQKLVPGSLEVHKMNLTGGKNGTEVGEAVPKEDYTVTDPSDANDNTLTVHFKKSINSAYYITFKTTLEGQLIKSNYKNTAVVKDGSTAIINLDASVSVTNGGKFVTKKGKQNEDFIDWSVYINESQSTLSNARVHDNPTDNQVLVPDSFHIYGTTVDVNGNLTKDASKELVPNQDYKLEIHTDKATGKQSFDLIFLKTIDRAYILEYKSLINAGDGEKVSNEVKLSADHITTEKVETIEEVIIKSSGGSGSGSGEKGSLEIIKVDAANETAPLAGAEFTLYDQTGKIEIRTVTTDESGKAHFDKLRVGSYLLKETKAPEGYLISDELKNGKIVAVQSKQKTSYTFSNQKFVGKVVLTKTDKESGEKLQGAVFTLHDQDGNTIPGYEKLITDGNGQLIADNLQPGNYQLKEIQAPANYDLDATPIPFTINPNQTTVVELSAVNSLTKGSVELVKVDEDSKAGLEGAVFSLQDKEGNDLQTGLTTDKDGKLVVKDLKPGEYQFVETKAPEGYKLDQTPVKFTIEKGQQSEATVTVTNEKLTVLEKPNDNPPAPKDGDFRTDTPSKDLLPKTGDSNDYTLMIAGLLLLLIGVLGIAEAKSKKRVNK